MDNKEKASWLTSLLTGWGVREVWAKIIAGAIIGALAAAGVLTQTGCTMNLTKLPDGTLSFSVGEQPSPVVVKEGK